MSKKASIAGAVVAGFPSPAEQYLGAPLDLNELLVKRPAATYFVRVKGDSMVNAGIRAGDLLVLDRSLTPADGDIIIAALDGEFTVKTYRTGVKTGADGRISPAARGRQDRSHHFQSASVCQSAGKPMPLRTKV